MATHSLEFGLTDDVRALALLSFSAKLSLER